MVNDFDFSDGLLAREEAEIEELVHFHGSRLLAAIDPELHEALMGKLTRASHPAREVLALIGGPIALQLEREREASYDDGHNHARSDCELMNGGKCHAW